MRLTEHELTVALTGTAKTVLASGRKFRKGGGDIDKVWDETDRFQRFKILDSIGTQIFPVLTDLPDVDVPVGGRPSFSEDEIRESVERNIGDDVGKLRRAVTVKARVALVQAALAHLPPRAEGDLRLDG
ncbi:hypothetical protein J2S40_000409 [Nocardioides luteus]|uniref:Uncharacterized protein n=1 Tax=Nocardioides luteus TaxID=1844 RepID=A0ABQ5SW95_9ACTN|nr:hypothetical protein [Nocardioides luteus]MDR7309351.1 hypothetical protein [Nocardioides luteus]GGR50704.1 hypothetical protein GCM10010197_15740 [Nocardioides luteus]GLJ67757.1 hypothetical protein GCM10017579_17930 [Nocardioides luteus]